MQEENTFEKKMERLEKIVNELEDGEHGIEETLKLFQEGVKLGEECRKILNDVELRVNKVLGIAENGEILTENFDDDV